jgi:hypothetical protein
VPTATPGHFDDYQVKRFATNLEGNQKRHITESLEWAIQTHNDPDSPFHIDAWYLTLPLNPTREQVHILGRPGDDSVCQQRVTSGQREPVPRRRGQRG